MAGERAISSHLPFFCIYVPLINKVATICQFPESKEYYGDNVFEFIILILLQFLKPSETFSDECFVVNRMLIAFPEVKHPVCKS